MGRAAISGTLTTTHSVRDTDRKTEEERKVIQKGVQKREGEKKQESSTANGNEGCIKRSAEGKKGEFISGWWCSSGQVVRLVGLTGGLSQNAASVQ